MTAGSTPDWRQREDGMSASDFTLVTAAMLWLASQPWYRHLSWTARAEDAFFLLWALAAAVVAVTYASLGLGWLRSQVQALLRRRNGGAG